MSANSQPIAIISCAVFQHLLEEMLPEGLDTEIVFLDYGLHLIPKNLKATVQKTIDSVSQPSLIVLGYGLCGNGLNGIEAGPHTLLVPRADDCISILMGSYDAYLKEFNGNPGTYYLTKGWLESGSDPLKEYHNMVEKYDRGNGRMVDERTVPALQTAGLNRPHRRGFGSVPS